MPEASEQDEGWRRGPSVSVSAILSWPNNGFVGDRPTLGFKDGRWVVGRPIGFPLHSGIRDDTGTEIKSESYTGNLAVNP